jgi:hypothetical protein
MEDETPAELDTKEHIPPPGTASCSHFLVFNLLSSFLSPKYFFTSFSRQDLTFTPEI